jgi:ATP10 protein
MSPHAFFKADRAKYAPNFSGMTIGPSIRPFESAVYAASKKATLLGFFSTQMAARMVKSYLEAVEKAFPSDPSVGVVRVQFEENWAKYALIRYYIMSRYLRPLYTPEQQVFRVV